jgi:NADPH2:quinone reductase
MRAVVVHALHDRDAVKVSDMPAPEPGPGEIVVDVANATVNFPDILMLDGKYQYRPDPPFILGKDAAGTVSAVGDGVDGWAVGERAMFYVNAGAFAEKCAVKVGNAYKVPDGVSLEDAAAMGLVYPTGWCALVTRGNLQPGESVMVTGAAGGVGLATVNLAKGLGAGKVLAAVSTPEKGEAAKAAGADHVIDTSNLEHKDAIRDQVYAVTDGKGVDICVDVVGGDVFDGAVRALAWGGRIMIVGFTEGRIPQIGTNYPLLKNIAIIGSPVAQYYERRPDIIQDAQEKLYDLVVAGKLTPHIMKNLPLDGFMEALRLVEDRQVIGKVLLTI